MPAEKSFFAFASAYYHYRYLLNIFSTQFSRELISEINAKLDIALRGAFALWTRFWDNGFPEKQYFLQHPEAFHFRADLSLTQRDFRNLLSQEEDMPTKLIVFKLLPILTVSIKLHLPDCLSLFVSDATPADIALWDAIFEPEASSAAAAGPSP
jgi:hypothetical protein